MDGDNQPKLLDQVRNAIRVRHYSRLTEKSYTYWVRFFIRFHKMRHPRDMGEDEVGQFLTFLAVKRNVAASTQNQALNAIVFLYKRVLDQPLGLIQNATRAKRPQKIPVVFSHDEIRRILEHMDGKSALITRLMYGAGLRIMECLRLRVKDIDFDRKEISVRNGKGGKDRVTVLPLSLIGDLNTCIRHAKLTHDYDLAEGYGEVSLPYALQRKYPKAGYELAWQYIFPSAHRSADPISDRTKRHHIFPDSIQRKVKRAIQYAGIHKHGSCHTFRHSFATHMLEKGYDIRTVAVPAHPCARGIRTSLCSTELLGHSNVNTTMIYTHVLNRGGRGVVSPID